MRNSGRKRPNSAKSRRRRKDGHSPGVPDNKRPAPPCVDARPGGKGDRHTVTLSDVARRARVGESTASRVMRNHGSVSPPTRERILKAAADLNYVPNRIAGTLASMTSKLVGLVMPSVGNTVVPEVLQGANLVLESAGFQPVIGVSNYDPAREEALIESVLSCPPCGLLVAGLE